MKTITPALQAHLSGTTTTLASCWKIIRQNGTGMFYTDHDQAIDFNGDTYKAATGYNRTAIQNDISASTDNLELSGLFAPNAIEAKDIRAGLYDHATIFLFMVNYEDLTQGEIKLRKGTLGEVSISAAGMFVAELRGMLQVLTQQYVQVYQPECRTDLGSPQCRIPVAPDLRQPSTTYSKGDYVVMISDGGAVGQGKYGNRIYEAITDGATAAGTPTPNTSVGASLVDGGVTWKTYEALTRHAVVDTVVDRTTFTITHTDLLAVDDWYNNGAVAFESGANSGVVVEVRNWVSATKTVTLFLPTGYSIEVGDLLKIYSGCDKRSATCKTKFAIAGSVLYSTGNVLNFRGEPFIPGSDQRGFVGGT